MVGNKRSLTYLLTTVLELELEPGPKWNVSTTLFRIPSMARNWISAVPQAAATAFALLFCLLILLLCPVGLMHGNTFR